ncbi:NAD-dependent epimerase/dehydratase family protein [Anaerobiospirillum thomasii]|uniref:NAD dependent epimerase/dehydratase family n=1 Tax=Anaerobiospirillum thomasii TaxID=179995 RepID=A0A2X0V8R9_9GAMM|nr:NAD(P)-dependent oxidoreductase [Anaerobiospirillum thomasii]SPT70864.1 NAD dependent epimerase/dehydratase family [Anaerobiospirillum thomasii]
MDRAIVFGANGNLGSAIVKALLSHNIETLALSRHTDRLDCIDSPIFRQAIVDAKDLSMIDGNTLLVNFVKGHDCAFYYTAWKGNERLRDGTLQEQMDNVTYVSDAIVLAAKLGCTKFIYTGTQDEAIFENYLKSEWKTKACPEHDINYMSAKLAARDMNLLISYLNKIDYIHTRFSAVINTNLEGVGFIPNTLKKLMNNEPIPETVNNNPMEIISIDELAEAYYHLGLKGKNKANYYLGCGDVDTISNLFKRFVAIKDNKDLNSLNLQSTDFSKQLLQEYDPALLFKDTNFKFTKNFTQIAKEIVLK